MGRRANLCCGKPRADVGDLHLGFLAYFGAFYKNYKPLNSGNAITLSTYFRNLDVVLLSSFNGLWTSKISSATKAASRTATVTSTAIVSISAV